MDCDLLGPSGTARMRGKRCPTQGARIYVLSRLSNIQSAANARTASRVAPSGSTCGRARCAVGRVAATTRQTNTRRSMPARVSILSSHRRNPGNVGCTATLMTHLRSIDCLLRSSWSGTHKQSIPETFAIDAVLTDLVVNDALGRRQQAGGFGAVATRGFQSIQNDIFFVGGDCFRQ